MAPNLVLRRRRGQWRRPRGHFDGLWDDDGRSRRLTVLSSSLVVSSCTSSGTDVSQKSLARPVLEGGRVLRVFVLQPGLGVAVAFSGEAGAPLLLVARRPSSQPGNRSGAHRRHRFEAHHLQKQKKNIPKIGQKYVFKRI